MSNKFLNLFLHFSSRIFLLKEKIVQSKSWTTTIPYATLLLITELSFMVISLPLYIVVSPKKVLETGFVFPSSEREPKHLHSYIVRRKITLTTVSGVGGLFVLKIVLVGIVTAYLLGVQPLLAAMQNWDMSVPSEYTYDSAKIDVTGGTAKLKATTTTASGATTNPDFTSNVAGWSNDNWNKGTGEVNPAMARQNSNGNPTGWVRIRIPLGNSDQLGGYWWQGFTTTVANPTTTVSFDWQVSEYDSTPNPITFKLYAFVDTGSGEPVIGQQVWVSPEMTSTSSWASVSNLDVSSRVTTAGTYYLKVAMWIETAATNGGPYSVGYDNVQLNWTKSTTTYPSDSPSIYPTTSLTPSNLTSWSSFTETATKNGGSINYQISNDEGVTWKYWNTTAWANAASASNSNPASVINTNIITFPTTAGKIKWKAFLTSSGSQLVILDNVAIGYTQNDPPSVLSLTASQDTTSGLVHVNYNLKDNDSDPEHLVNYEYSLTGAFSGEQVPMTPATSDPAHNGISSLTSSPSDVAHTFVWNALIDLGNTYHATVYVRLRANDNITNGDFVASSAFAVDYVWPFISNVSATQVSSSSNIQINYDVFDNTVNPILVELQVSSDGGSTWTVPAITLSGDVGTSVTSGNGKSMIWHAGADFASQEQNNMRVQIRPRDKYQNQGDYAESNIFALDNRAPIIATPTDLLAQPLAGATAVLVSGSFSEGNPNTNNFYVAVNGGSYGSAQVGDTDTATPSDKSVPVGATLKGNDYISAVKIIHTDDFGLTTANENSSPNSIYKYVKPYTPLAPTISSPGADSLSLTINKNSSETDGLEYAILESTGNLYVQSDGSLGASPYWQVAGAVTVTGLSQPISQYSFQTKSRNSSDTSFAPSSESDFSSGASSDYQSPQITIISNTQTTDGTKYVVINYTGTDYQDAPNRLTKYDYSLNNTDWLPMTEKTGVESDGITGLAFTSGGTGLTFAWDIGTDLSSVEDSAVYIRLESNDSITNSNTATSAAFTVNTTGPVVSNIQATQTTATDNMVITYDLADGAGANNTVDLSISDDSGVTYNISSVGATGDIGSNIAAGLERTITWNAVAGLLNQEKNTMKVKIMATDSYGNEGSPLESSDFSTDTKAPVVNDVSATQIAGSALVTVNYTLADLSASEVEFEASANSGGTWVVATDTYTGDMGKGQTAGAKTFSWNAVVDFPDQELSTMQIRVRAKDVFNHQGDYEPSADFSVNTKMLSISNISATQAAGGRNVIIHYDLNKNATINIEISSDGGTTWTVPKTTLTGAVGADVQSGNNKTVAWDAGTDFSDQEKTSMRIHINGTDELEITSPFYESSDFSVDTGAPLGLSSLNKFANTESSVTMNWSGQAMDANFDHYELWHGATRADVINRTGTAVKWGTTNDPALGSATTVSTVITDIALTSDYFVKIWAVDIYGNEVTIDDTNVFAPIVTFNLTVQASDGSGSVDPAVGSHTYNEGGSVDITATATEGWVFDHWILDGGAGGSANPLTLTINSAHTLKAVFIESTSPPNPPETPTPAPAYTAPTQAEVVNLAKPILTPIATPIAITDINVSGLAQPQSNIDLYDDGVLVVRINNPADGNGKFSQTIKFSTGNHILTAKAVDASGNSSETSDSISFEIVTENPETPIILSPRPGDNITDSQPTLVGVAISLSKIEITLDGINKFTVSADVNGTWRFGVPSDFALQDGAHTFAAKSIDLAGNVSEETTLNINKITQTVPITTPVETPAETPGGIPTPGGLPNANAPGLAPAPIVPAPVAPIITPIPPASIIRDVNEATELPGVPVPEVTAVNTVNIASVNDTFAFSGKALPNQDVVVYINSDQALVYRTTADNEGIWRINHSQNLTELAPGQHTIFAVAIDPTAKVKSAPSPVSTFTVTKNFWVDLFNRLNLTTTVVTFVIVLLILIWLYRIRGKGKKK